MRAAASNLPIIYGQVELLDATGQVLDTQQLPTGNFDFTDLEPGSYYVRTVDTEFLNQEAGGAECETVQCVLTSGTPIVVTDGGSENVPFLLGGLGPLFRNSFEDVDFVNWHSNYLSAP